MRTDIVKETGVRKVARPLNVGNGFYETVDDRVRELIEDAADRARANDRRTIQAKEV